VELEGEDILVRGGVNSRPKRGKLKGTAARKGGMVGKSELSVRNSGTGVSQEPKYHTLSTQSKKKEGHLVCGTGQDGEWDAIQIEAEKWKSEG